MKILIADDHPIMRQGLKSIIEKDDSFQVVADVGDGDEALELLMDIEPDIAVVDISMPGKSGLDLVQACQHANLKTLFVILTMYKEEEYFDEAMDLGVKGYLLKENASTDLLGCLKAVGEGKHYMSATISDFLLNRHSRIQKLQEKMPALEQLTAMEKQILKLIAKNRTSKEIATELFISYRTVQNHRNNICQKLGFKGHNKLLQFAIQNKSRL